MKAPFKLAQLSWGWITPGTTEQLREKQEDGFLTFWKKWGKHRDCRFAFTHSGWYLDRNPGAAVARLTRQNPEPFRATRPVSARLASLWRTALREKRLEFVAYPYAGCVAEATDGETLLRSLRLSLEQAASTLGARPEGVLNHDAPYGLNWGAEQMPQIARLLGFQYLVAGKTGMVEALDGSVMPCVGSDCNLVGTIRSLCGEEPPWSPRFVVLEMHDHLFFLGHMLAGEHPLQGMQPVQFYSLSRKAFQRSQQPGLSRFPARQLGAKGWFGGLFDVLMIEQDVYRAQRILQALETREALERIKGRDAAKQTGYWKRSLILTDTAILWQCHDYRLHYRRESDRLLKEVRAESTERDTGRNVGVFNPLSWPRGGVVWEDDAETPAGFHPGLTGWQTGRIENLPTLRKRVFSKGVTLQTSDARYRFDTEGGCLHVSGNPKSKAQEVARPGIHRLEESRQTRSLTLVRGDAPEPFTGNAVLELDWKLSDQDPPTYLFRIECAAILGDAYLLECEFLDLSGAVRETIFHALHSPGWEGGGMPQHRSHPHPVELNLRYFQRVRLKIHVACEGGLQFNGIRAVPLRGPVSRPVEFNRIQARLHTAVRYRPLRLKPDAVRRWGNTIGEIRYRLDERDLSGVLSVRGGRLSPWLEYHLALDCESPAPLGWHTPPLTSRDGSFLGAGCERPYIPGLMFEAGVRPDAQYMGDSPYLLREVLRDFPETWHTDRRDWWMGFSPFVAVQMAVARDETGTHLIATRGLRHFFRHRDREREALGLSLGSGLPHPLMQGFSVPESSPLFSLLGHSFFTPYRDGTMLHASGRYDFHFGYAKTLRGTDPSVLWKRGQEYANPLIRAGDAPSDGLVLHSDKVVATACELRDHSRILRLLNLSPQPVSSSFQAGSKNRKISLPPYGLREVEF